MIINEMNQIQETLKRLEFGSTSGTQFVMNEVARALQKLRDKVYELEREDDSTFNKAPKSEVWGSNMSVKDRANHKLLKLVIFLLQDEEFMTREVPEIKEEVLLG